MKATILLWLGLCLSLAAQPYAPPANHRADINLNPGWRFIRQDVAGAQTNGFDDSAWTTLDLPHTWNNLDGQDGGNNYYRGIGWYRTHYAVDSGYTNRHFFLKFDGAFLVTDVYVNGTLLGEHQGGFAAFVFDVTTNLNVGADNVIAVKVSNAANTNIAPLSADFTFFGGLYRDVHLLATDPLHVSPLDFASPGVYLKPANVSSNSANLQVTTLVSNANPSAVTATVRTVITDAASNIVTTLTNVVTLPPASLSNVVANATVANPHLWNGLADPYLYQAHIEIYNGTNLTDVVSQPLGFRWFSVDPANGFFLNGRYYDVHGVCMHQDYFNLGWALTDAQRETNFTLLKELGVTGIRLAHYQHAEHTYRLGDQNGIVLWSEVPLVNSVNSTAAFLANAQQQLKELIRQNFNHPAIICWNVFNEITLSSGPSPNSVVANLVQLAAQEDPTRLSSGATLASPTGNATSWMPQLAGFNEYYGWYESPLEYIGTWADTIHAAHPTNCFAVTEYGAGASIYQHSEDPVAKPTTTGGLFHPEEYQNLLHETNWALMQTRPFIWGKFLWNMFDFAVDSRNEGDTPGRNDKGLVTFDRQVRKDAFYFYKANWTTNPMVYITGHTFPNRLTNSISAKVYANCDSVELFLNGVSQGPRTSGNFIFTWPVTLSGGSNFVQAVGSKGGSNVIDSLGWIAPFGLAITSPSAPVVWLNGINDTLELAAVLTNSAGPFPILWSQTSGPGAVTFGSSNAPSTTAHFSLAGVYGLTATASLGGASASASIAVVVNSNSVPTNGLIAWWKMDETNGATAADASGNSRTAAITGASFTGGYLANALQFTTATSRATFAAADTNRVTVAAWVRCDTTGGGSFPRIVDGPSYRLFFRFSSSDLNSVGFATYDTTNGDFDSGAGSIGLGSWYHVVASYDRSSNTNRPAFYVNGTKLPTVTLAAPSGPAPALSGTGYIGNNSALTRNWNGLIDDLRIYNRLLNDAEVQVLAALPFTNLAPIVSAGTNLTVVLPATANLNGGVADDGNPNPPGAITTAWLAVSGPGAVTFANTNAPVTTASFSAPGTYTLRLTATDGQVKMSIDVLVSVVARPAVGFQWLPGTLQLSWPTNALGWRLQTQTNASGFGLDTNWVDVPGSAGTNWMELMVDPTGGSVFYRLVYP